MSDLNTAAIESALQDQASRLVCREVLVCLSSMVSALASGCGSLDSSTGDLANLTDQAMELACPITDWEEAATQAGWTYCAKSDAWTHDNSEEYYSGAQEICEEENIEPYDREVYEHWAVSTWLAEKLTEAGERVDTDFAGLNVWARTTTGQAISMDGVIRDIARALHA